MSDPLIREIPRIRRYSRHNEAEDFRFRAFLLARRDLDDATLDAMVRETAQDVWAQIDCTACGNCCRTLQIVVDARDIRRLAARLDIPAPSFRRRYVRVDGDGILHFAAAPCAFLGEDNRCTVYEDRPQACRDFPYLHEEGFRRRTLSMIENNATCPIVFNVWQRLKRRLGPQRRKRER